MIKFPDISPGRHVGQLLQRAHRPDVRDHGGVGDVVVPSALRVVQLEGLVGQGYVEAAELGLHASRERVRVIPLQHVVGPLRGVAVRRGTCAPQDVQVVVKFV